MVFFSFFFFKSLLKSQAEEEDLEDIQGYL